MPGKTNTRLADDQEVARKLERIYEQLHSLLRAEYERGGREAAVRIMNLVIANDGDRGETAMEPPRSSGRVPHGAARRFIEKMLVAGPMTIQEMRGAAKSDLERQLSYQTIRLELERGRRAKRYKKDDKRWSLAAKD